MQSKLTLRIDDELIRRAKREAHARGVSVSALVAGYLSALSSSKEDQPLTPSVQRLRGLLRDASSDRDSYRRYLKTKYEI